MSACTFFGHRDCRAAVKPQLVIALQRLICDLGVTEFYVGRQGAFDALVLGVLREMVVLHPHIRYAVVFERIPEKKQPGDPAYTEILVPDGIETVPPRYAIDRRNRWMISQSDYIVCCISRGWGGAAKYTSIAERKGKKIIYIDP